MRRIFLFLAMAIGVCSCGTKTVEEPPQIGPDFVWTAMNTPISLADTLEKYSGADSIQMSLEGSGMLIEILIIGRVGKQAFALYTDLDDGTAHFYNRLGGKWQIPDTIEHAVPYGGFLRTDVNGDGYRDIRFGQQSGRSTVFLYRSRSKRFVHTHRYCTERETITVDTETVHHSFVADSFFKE